MNHETFNAFVKEQLSACEDMLCKKAVEYATEDRLHQFKVAAELQNCTPEQALAGMMGKHTVSIYDMCNGHGKVDSLACWTEKITDHINYLLLLKAVVIEQQNRKESETIISDMTCDPLSVYGRVKYHHGEGQTTISPPMCAEYTHTRPGPYNDHIYVTADGLTVCRGYDYAVQLFKTFERRIADNTKAMIEGKNSPQEQLEADSKYRVLALNLAKKLATDDAKGRIAICVDPLVTGLPEDYRLLVDFADWVCREATRWPEITLRTDGSLRFPTFHSAEVLGLKCRDAAGDKTNPIVIRKGLLNIYRSLRDLQNEPTNFMLTERFPDDFFADLIKAANYELADEKIRQNGMFFETPGEKGKSQ